MWNAYHFPHPELSTAHAFYSMLTTTLSCMIQGILLLSPSYRWGNRGLRMVSDLPKVAELIVSSWVSMSPEPGFLTTMQSMLLLLSEQLLKVTDAPGISNWLWENSAYAGLPEAYLHCPFVPLGTGKSIFRLQMASRNVPRFHGYGLFVVCCIYSKDVLVRIVN